MKSNRRSRRRAPPPFPPPTEVGSTRLRHLTKDRNRQQPISIAGEGRVGADRRDAALELAIAALGFIARDGHELSRFLALTAIDHGSIRTPAQEPGFRGGVLAYIAGNGQTLLTF